MTLLVENCEPLTEPADSASHLLASCGSFCSFFLFAQKLDFTTNFTIYMWRSPALPSPMQLLSYFRFIVSVMPCHSHHFLVTTLGWFSQELRAKVERIQYFTPPSVVLKRRDRHEICRQQGQHSYPPAPYQPL